MSQQFGPPDPQKLNNLLASASASAILLLDEGIPLVASGELSQTGFDAMAAAMRTHWPIPVPQDLNRTVGLSLDQKYVFLFSKYLPDSKVLLGMVFPMKTPLIRIRQDMTQFMRLFLEQSRSERGLDKGLEQSLQSMDIIGPMPDPELHQLPGIWNLETKHRSKDMPLRSENLPAGPDKKTSIPEPQPWLDATNAPWHAADMASESSKVPSEWQPLIEEQPQEGDLVSILQGKYHSPGHYQPSRTQDTPSTGNESQVRKSVDLDETRPCGPGKIRDTTIQTVSDITLYLAPAAPRHFLIGELSGWLRRWMTALCGTYGWQMGSLSIRPDYLKWTLVDFPEILIREMLQAVRRETSERIFRVFPNLKAENHSGDFWAPGYLVDTQDREFTTQALMTHLAANRSAAQSPKP